MYLIYDSNNVQQLRICIPKFIVTESDSGVSTLDLRYPDNNNVVQFKSLEIAPPSLLLPKEPTSFTNASWTDIDNWSKDCVNNPSKYEALIGCDINRTFSFGVTTGGKCRLVAINHNVNENDEKIGFTFMLYYAYKYASLSASMKNDNWYASNVKTTIDDYFATWQTPLSSVVKTAKIECAEFENGSTVIHNHLAKVWSPSPIELSGSSPLDGDTAGEQFEYFVKNQNAQAMEISANTSGNSRLSYWLRSCGAYPTSGSGTYGATYHEHESINNVVCRNYGSSYTTAICFCI